MDRYDVACRWWKAMMKCVFRTSRNDLKVPDAASTRQLTTQCFYLRPCVYTKKIRFFNHIKHDGMVTSSTYMLFGYKSGIWRRLSLLFCNGRKYTVVTNKNQIEKRLCLRNVLTYHAGGYRLEHRAVGKFLARLRFSALCTSISRENEIGVESSGHR